MTFCKHTIFRIAPKFHNFFTEPKSDENCGFYSNFSIFSDLFIFYGSSSILGGQISNRRNGVRVSRKKNFLEIEFFAFLSTPTPGEQFLIIFRTIRAVLRKLRPIFEGAHFFEKNPSVNGKEKSAVKYVLP